MNVEEKVKEILLEILDVKQEDIVPQASLIDNLGADSIDLVEIRTAFENTFDINIADDSGFNLKTVQDAVDFIKAAILHRSAD
jgi:acyl carrier protein